MQRRRFHHMHARCGPPPDGPLAHLSRDVTQQCQLYWEDENLESVNFAPNTREREEISTGQEASRVCRGAQVIQ